MTGTSAPVPVQATAEIVRHLLPIPFVFIGLAFVRWAEPIAQFYTGAFGRMGLNSYKKRYERPAAKGWIRLAGVFFVAVSLYWIIVGTG
jgi:hypothetical protein